jgi:hypothetical protein
VGVTLRVNDRLLNAVGAAAGEPAEPSAVLLIELIPEHADSRLRIQQSSGNADNNE